MGVSKDKIRGVCAWATPKQKEATRKKKTGTER